MHAKNASTSESYNGHAPPPGLHDWRPLFDPTQTPCDAQTVLEMVHTSPSKASLPDGCVFVTELQKPWWFLHPLAYSHIMAEHTVIQKANSFRRKS